MQPVDGHFYTKDEETPRLLLALSPFHVHFDFLVVGVVAVVDDVAVDAVVAVAVVVVFLSP